MLRVIITILCLICLIYPNPTSAEEREGVTVRLSGGVGAEVGSHLFDEGGSLGVSVGWAVAPSLGVQLAFHEVWPIASNVGLGLVYYLADWYWSASWGVAWSPEGSGWGINHLLGREWAVSENWGLGVGGQLLVFSTGEEDPRFAVGVVMTGTYW